MDWLKKTLSFLFQVFLMLILPFWLLIFGSVFLYESYDWHFVPSLLVMAGIVFLLLLIYVAMLWDAIFGANKISRASLKGKAWFVGILMLFYTGYMLFNLSGQNAKTDEVRKEYRSLHPYLRLAVGTLVWIDKDVLITDLSRVKEDYTKMGLPSLNHSLHYKQSTGFTHAMDLRTKGRSEFRNTLLQGYFRIMGLNTLRHGGTADHLHVSLSIPENPKAI